jgi:hypothetical protein
MALEGMPYRHRQKQGTLSRLVLMRLTQPDFEEVSTELDELLTTWDTKLGIRVQLAEDVQKPNDITALALALQKLAFFDVVDCFLVAASLAVLATEFLTTDGVLAEILEKIKDPSRLVPVHERQLWRVAQQGILAELRKLTLTESLDVADLVQPKRQSSLGADVSRLRLI